MEKKKKGKKKKDKPISLYPLDPEETLKDLLKIKSPKKKNKKGKEIFINYNYETFEVKNKSEFYINSSIYWCKKYCSYKNCKNK